MLPLFIIVLCLYFQKGGSTKEVIVVNCFCNLDESARASLSTVTYAASAASSLISATHSLVSAGFTVTPAIVLCDDASSFDVLRDPRLSPSARSSVLRRSRRSWSDIIENRHITSYLCHVEALSIIQKSGASMGVVLFGEAKLNLSSNEIIFNVPIITSTAASLLANRDQYQEGIERVRENIGLEKVRENKRGQPEETLEWDLLLLETGQRPQLPFSYLHLSTTKSGRNDCEGPSLSTASWYQKLVCSFDGLYSAVRAAGVSLSVLEAIRSFFSTTLDGSSTLSKDKQSLPILHQAPGPWKQMSSYAVTNFATNFILGKNTSEGDRSNVDLLPMNVRFESLISSLSELGFLQVGYLSWSMLRGDDLNKLVHRSVLLSDDDEGIECDLCDLPIQYDRVAVINGHILSGIVLGLFLGILFKYSCNGIIKRFFDIVLLFLTSTSAPKLSWIHSFYYIERILHHPFFLVSLFFLFGYNVSFETSRAPWPSSRSQSIEIVPHLSSADDMRLSSSTKLLPPLPSKIDDLWNKYLAVMLNSTVHHATVATRSHPNLDRLTSTANWHGNSIHIMGGNDSLRFPKWGAGFGVKLELVHGLLRSLPRNDILLFTDAFDVLLMQSHDSIRNSFLSAARLKLSRHLSVNASYDTTEDIRIPTILFSAEFFCHPDPERYLEYPNEDHLYSNFAYLNSGTFIGQVGSLLDAMDRAPNYTLQDDDQRYWTNIYLSSLCDPTLPRIELDHEHDVFLCMNKYRADGDLRFDPSTRHFSFSGDRDRRQGGSGGGDSMESRGIPSIVHFNGRKDDVESFFTALSGVNIAPTISYVPEPAMSLWEQGFVTLRDFQLAPNISYHRFKYLLYGERSSFWTPYTISGNKSLLAILVAVFIIASILGVALGRAIDDDGP